MRGRERKRERERYRNIEGRIYRIREGVGEKVKERQKKV